MRIDLIREFSINSFLLSAVRQVFFFCLAVFTSSFISHLSYLFPSVVVVDFLDRVGGVGIPDTDVIAARDPPHEIHAADMSVGENVVRSARMRLVGVDGLSLTISSVILVFLTIAGGIGLSGFTNICKVLTI